MDVSVVIPQEKHKIVWWLNLAWLPGAHPAVLSLSHLNRTGTENKIKSSWVETGTGRVLSTYPYGQKRLDLGKFSLVSC